MFQKIKGFLSFTVGFWASIFISVWNGFIAEELAVDILQLYATISAAGTILVGLRQYLYQVEKDKKSAVIEQVSFFRREVMSKHTEFVDQARQNGQIISRIALKRPDSEAIGAGDVVKAREQIKSIKKPESAQLELDILNLMEEFSLRVCHHEIQDHEALNQIKNPFVEIVERHSIPLLAVREVFVGAPTYSTTLYLYNLWKDQVDRRTWQQRVTKKWKELGL